MTRLKKSITKEKKSQNAKKIIILWIAIVKCVFPTPFSFIYNKKKNRRSHNQVQLEKKIPC